MAKSYCLKCKRTTDNKDVHTEIKKGRKMQKSNCSVCGCKKCKFVK